MVEIKHLTESDFEATINSGVSFVSFWAPWCGPCRMMAPVYDQVSQEVENVNVCKFNVDDSSELSSSIGIKSVPTLRFYKNGKLEKELIGVTSKAKIIEEINNLKDLI